MGRDRPLEGCCINRHKKVLALLLAALCGVSLVSCTSISITYEEIPAPALEGSLLGEETKQFIALLLPKEYGQSTEAYPVLYFLPGFSADYRQVAKLLAHALGSQPQGSPSMIVVIINGTSKLGGGFYADSPVSGNWADYVLTDVVDYVDSHYRTLPKPEARGLAGHSMGGFGAIHLALNAPGRFRHVYSMSPGLFDNCGVENAKINFSLLRNSFSRYAGRSAEKALPAYLKEVQGLQWPDNFSFAYASAFAYDWDAGFPYFMLPEQDGDGAVVRDERYARYANGFGGWETKLEAKGDALRQLQSFAIEYGLQDELTWIPEGAAALCRLLVAQGIAHTELPFQGGHTNRLQERMRDWLLPFFAAGFEL